MAEREPAYLAIGRNGPDGGCSCVAWGITDEDADMLGDEFRRRIGEPEVEAAADEAAVMRQVESFAANAVVIKKDAP